MDKKTKILEATERVLAEQGFERISIQMVAKNAGVATGTIYRYFVDKNDLLTQLREHVLKQCAAKMFHDFKDDFSDEIAIKNQFILLWKNTWNLTIDRDDGAINKEQFDSLPYKKNGHQKQSEREVFAPIHRFFQRGISMGIFKPLGSDVLSSIGIEPAFFLARKQVNGLINLNASECDDVLEACWDAICLNKKLELLK